MDKPLPKETIERILLTAESLFAENGYDGTTLRQITQAAKVNLAAVNYHHGDKESLYLAIIRRRIQPINRTRLDRLTATEAAAGGEPVPLATIFEIMAGPLLDLFASENPDGRHAARLLGRSLTDPLPFMEGFLAEEFQPVMARFGQALRRHGPTLPPEDFLWRLNFVVGALLHTLASLHRMRALTRGICRDNDHAGALPRFVQFATGAFSHPPTTGQPG